MSQCYSHSVLAYVLGQDFGLQLVEWTYLMYQDYTANVLWPRTSAIAHVKSAFSRPPLPIPRFSTSPCSIPLLAVLALRATTPASSSVPSARASSTPRFARRRSHERKVHRDRLVEQLLIMRAINSSASLLQRRVLNQRVSLESPNVSAIHPHVQCVLRAYLDVTASSVEVQVHVLDLAVLSKKIL